MQNLLPFKNNKTLLMKYVYKLVQLFSLSYVFTSYVFIIYAFIIILFIIKMLNVKVFLFCSFVTVDPNPRENNLKAV